MTCAYCGDERDKAVTSNSVRSVTLTLSEHEAAVLAGVMVMASNREGMHGNYHTARLLKTIYRALEPVRIGPRGLNPEGISQVMAAQDEGWELSYSLSQGKPEVLINGRSPEGREIILAKCSIPKGEIDRDVLEKVRDFFDRRPTREGIKDAPGQHDL